MSLFKHVERRQLTEIVFYQAKGFKIGQKNVSKRVRTRSVMCHSHSSENLYIISLSSLKENTQNR